MSAVVRLPDILIRPMTGADLDAVTVVEAAAYEFPWTRGIFRDCLYFGYHCRVLEGNSGVIGHGVLSIGARECHLLNICVHPDHQRHGHGRELVRTLLDEAHERGACTVFLEVRVSNLAAQRLYADLGFNEIGRRRAYYPAREGREDAILFARELV